MGQGVAGVLTPLGQLPPLVAPRVSAPERRTRMVNVGRLFPVITPSAQRHRPGRHPGPARATDIAPLANSRTAGSGLSGLIVLVTVAVLAAIWTGLAAYRRRRAS